MADTGPKYATPINVQCEKHGMAAHTNKPCPLCESDELKRLQDRKFFQIAVSPAAQESDVEEVYALDGNGDVWYYDWYMKVEGRPARKDGTPSFGGFRKLWMTREDEAKS